MTLTLRSGVHAASTTTGMVLLDERSSEYWQLNRSASLALRFLLDGTGPEEVAKRLAEHYGVSSTRTSADVDSLVTALRAAKLVTP